MERFLATMQEELKKQTDAEMFEETRMKDYRAQLDKEREERLAKGRNHADKRDKLKKSTLIICVVKTGPTPFRIIVGVC